MIPEPRNPLERLLAPLEPATVTAVPGEGQPLWLTSGEWRVFVRPNLTGLDPGEEIESFTLPDGNVVRARRSTDSNAVRVPFSLGEAYENYVSERWRSGTQVKELSVGQLALFYRVKRLIPRRVQLTLRRALIRWQGLPEFPVWPLDESVLRLVQFYAKCLLLARDERELPFRWFWPADYRAALILTHDVESGDGLRLAVDLADVEEERGFRSSFNIVASWYPIDFAIVRELAGRGFEIGVHGVKHDRSMFASRESFEAQQPMVRKALTEFGAAGFRSPSTHRVYEWIADLPVSYDCSIPHSDPFEPQPGGCCTVWPFFIGDVVELPYTLPQDHTLLTLLRHSSAALWLTELDRIEAMGGLAQLLSHPDRGYLGDSHKRAIYVDFLDAARERTKLWKPLPCEVAEWWRQRDSGSAGRWEIAQGRALLDSQTGDVVLGPQAAYL